MSIMTPEILESISLNLHGVLGSIVYARESVKAYTVLCYNSHYDSLNQAERARIRMINAIKTTWRYMGITEEERDALIECLEEFSYIPDSNALIRAEETDQ